jgi:hypothetical protein
VSNLIHSTDRAEIWHGDCLDPEHVAAVMGGRKADLLFVDAPYSEKTQKGHGDVAKAGQDEKQKPIKFSGTGRPWEKRPNHGGSVADIEYSAWSPSDVATFCAVWLPVTSGWAVSVTDHTLAPAWSDGMEQAGRYVFAPLPWLEIGSRIRMAGDGPSSWCAWVIVSRPRCLPWSKWGTLPGAYVGTSDRGKRADRVVGGKSFPLMRDIIKDYSRPGALVVDPCLGGGTTMVAALAEGRRCIGMEKDAGRADKCRELLMGSRGNEKQRGLF